MVSFFFCQAEDGIRYADVTGVQTCALPIFTASWASHRPRPTRSCAPLSAPASDFRLSNPGGFLYTHISPTQRGIAFEGGSDRERDVDLFTNVLGVSVHRGRRVGRGSREGGSQRRSVCADLLHLVHADRDHLGLGRVRLVLPSYRLISTHNQA